MAGMRPTDGADVQVGGVPGVCPGVVDGTDAVAVLRRLLAGQADAAAHVANALRVEAFGRTTFGRTDALDLFAAHPLAWPADAPVSVAAQSLSMVGNGVGAVGVFADLSEGVISRVWVVSNTLAEVATEAAVPVARDDFMDQLREQGHGDPGDHPDLRAQDWRHVQALGAAALQSVPSPTAASSSQFWVLRSFSAGDSVVALVRLRVLTAGLPRQAHDRLALGVAHRLAEGAAHGPAQGLAQAASASPGAVRHQLVVSCRLPCPAPVVF